MHLYFMSEFILSALGAKTLQYTSELYLGLFHIEKTVLAISFKKNFRNVVCNYRTHNLIKYLCI